MVGQVISSRARNLNWFLGALGLLLASMLVTLTGEARATAYVLNFNLSANVTQSTNIVPTTLAGGVPGTARNRLWILLGQFQTLNLMSGDTLDTNIFFDAPITLESTGAPNTQTAAFTISSGIPNPGFTHSFSSNATFGGATGDFLGDPMTISATISNIPGQFVVGGATGVANLTNSTMTFSSIHFFTTFTAMSPLNAPFTVGFLNITDQHTPVPVPAAISFLILGFIIRIFGFSTRRIM